MARFRFPSRTLKSVQPGPVGRLFLSLFFAVFLAGGLFSAVMIGRWFIDTVDTYTWQAMSCRIVSSEVETHPKSDSPHEFQVTYTYQINGREYLGRRHRLSEASRFDNYGDAQRLADRFAPGTDTTCHVDPDDPARAILERGNLWSGLALLFPLPFIAIGVGGLWFALRGRRRQENADGTANSISERAKDKKSATVVLALFFLVFFVAGSAFFHLLFLRPVLKNIAARDWPRVPCIVISSRVKSHSSDEGTTYSVDILYRYTFDDRELKSNRYSFETGSSSGYAGKKKIVKQYPLGRETFCYVDPDDPFEAVLNREVIPWLGLITLVFVLTGAGGLIGVGWSHHRKRTAAAPPGQVTERRTSPDEHLDSALRQWLPSYTRSTEPVTLKPGGRRFIKLLGAVGAAVLWNGIVSVFLIQVYEGFQKGDPEWFLTIFMLPFVVVGLGLIGAIFYFLLALVNPLPILTVSTDVLCLGDPLDVASDLIGRTGKIRRLRVYVEGRESATYTQGTSTCTDKETFSRLPLLDTQDPIEIAQFAGSVKIPSDTMHSVDLGHNKIGWYLVVHGEIPFWPDVKEEFDLAVLPAELREEGRS